MTINNWQIEKNQNIASCTRNDVLNSELFYADLKSITVNVTSSENNNASSGSLIVSKKGLAFFTDGSKSNSPFPWIAFAGAQAGGLVGCLIGAAIESSIKSKNANSKLEKMLNHPNIFAIPHTDIISVRYYKEGGFMSNKRFLVIRAQSSNTIKEYKINPIDVEYVELLAVARFLSEKEQLTANALANLGMNECQNNIIAFMESNYGHNWQQSYMHEFTRRLEEGVKQLLSSKGLTENDIERAVMSNLNHFLEFPIIRSNYI